MHVSRLSLPLDFEIRNFDYAEQYMCKCMCIQSSMHVAICRLLLPHKLGIWKFDYREFVVTYLGHNVTTQFQLMPTNVY